MCVCANRIHWLCRADTGSLLTDNQRDLTFWKKCLLCFNLVSSHGNKRFNITKRCNLRRRTHLRTIALITETLQSSLLLESVIHVWKSIFHMRQRNTGGCRSCSTEAGVSFQIFFENTRRYFNPGTSLGAVSKGRAAAGMFQMP